MSRYDNYEDEGCYECGKPVEKHRVICDACLTIERVDAQLKKTAQAVEAMLARKAREDAPDDYCGEDDLERHRLEVESDERNQL